MTDDTQLSPDLAARLDAAIDRLFPQALDVLRRMVRVNSVNPLFPGVTRSDVIGGEAASGAILTEYLTGFGFDAEIVAPDPDRPNTVLTRAGTGGGWTVRRATTAAAFGGATIGMNAMFYEAIARLPLGAAVAIEFLGPIAVAAAGSRKPADVCALLLVVAGVGAIASAQFEGGEVGLVGIAFALGSAALWAGHSSCTHPTVPLSILSLPCHSNPKV